MFKVAKKWDKKLMKSVKLKKLKNVCPPRKDEPEVEFVSYGMRFIRVVSASHCNAKFATVLGLIPNSQQSWV